MVFCPFLSPIASCSVEYAGLKADGPAVQDVIKSKHGHRTVPAVFVNGE